MQTFPGALSTALMPKANPPSLSTIAVRSICPAVSSSGAARPHLPITAATKTLVLARSNSCIHDRDGSSFAVFHFKPEDGLMGPGMHSTDTIDYVVVLKGRLEFHSETGVVELRPGDLVVDRGVSHGWRAVGDEPAMTAVVMLPAHPVGSGATI